MKRAPCDTCGSEVDPPADGSRLANCPECGAAVVFPAPEPLPVIQPQQIEPKRQPPPSAPVCVHCGADMARTRRTRHTPLNALALFFVGVFCIVFSFGCMFPVLFPLGAIMVILSPFRMRERENVMGCGSCGHFYQLLR
jgi:hypothetical protein